MSRRVDDIGDDIGDGVETIRQEYRRLRAPDQTLRRVHARLSEERPRRPTLPAAAAVAAALAVAALLLAMPRTELTEPEIRPTSLTVLSLAAGSNPGGAAMPGLSTVRGMSLPAPPGPATGADALAPSPMDTELEDLRNHSRDDEEKDHANS